MKHNNIQIIGIPEEEQEQGIETLFEKILTKNFLNLERRKPFKFRKYRIPIKMNPESSSKTHHN